jgi:peptide/nickel transport system permease protein
MLSTARGYMPDFWWSAVFPGIAIFLAVFSFNLLGDGLRDVLDPKARR